MLTALPSLLSRVEIKPISMRVFIGDQEAGSATYLQKLLTDGGKQVAITLKLKPASGPMIEIRQESVYDALGYPSRRIQESLTAEGKRTELRVATFDETGATLTIEKGGKSTDKAVELVKGAPRTAKSEFWFFRDTPKKGDKATFYSFDLGEERWKLTEAIYAGETEIEVGGKKVKAHRVSAPPSEAYLDDKGWPIRLDIGRVRLERATL